MAASLLNHLRLRCTLGASSAGVVATAAVVVVSSSLLFVSAEAGGSWRGGCSLVAGGVSAFVVPEVSSCQRGLGDLERLNRLRSPDMGTSLMHDSDLSVLLPKINKKNLLFQ